MGSLPSCKHKPEISGQSDIWVVTRGSDADEPNQQAVYRQGASCVRYLEIRAPKEAKLRGRGSGQSLGRVGNRMSGRDAETAGSLKAAGALLLTQLPVSCACLV